MITRFNTELANDLGNLLSRVLTMIDKYFSGRIPHGEIKGNKDASLQKSALSIPALIEEDLLADNAGLTHLSFTAYLRDVWMLITHANGYVEKNAPWTLAKNKDMERLGAVLYNLSESLRLIALYLYPVMPSTCQKIWDALGIDKKIAECRMGTEQAWGMLVVGTAIQPGAQLFPRIDQKKNTEKKMEKTEETQKPASKPETAGPEPIGIEDFMKVDLRVGKIVSAERVTKSEKLVKLQVDIGSETRQVVAGIGKSYTPEELTGKTIVIVANLKPAKLMGIESQGMLLAGSSGDLLAVATFDREMKPGAKVK
jgi:methionyl-tRNA synthetase